MVLGPSGIFQGDCIEGLAQLEPGSVDLAFADPPFNIGYDYDVYHDRRASEEYLDWSRKWMSGVRRALKPTGTFWLAIGDEYAAELKLIAQKEAGFSCRSWVIWYYTFGVNCARGFSRSHTHLFHFVCDAEKFTFNSENPAVRVPSARQLVYADARANPHGRLPDNTWILRPQDLPQGFAADEDIWYFSRVAGTFKEREGFHGCQMPEQLLGRIVRCSSNPMEVVLDPFGGSGTTLAVAKKLARQYIGFELSGDYAARIKLRLENAQPGDPLDGVADPLSSVPTTAAGRRRPLSRAAAIPGKRGARPAAKTGPAGDEVDPGVIRAYKATHRGYSVDYLLAEPELNAAFVAACKKDGVPGEAVGWNRALLRIRKSGKLPGLKKHGKTLTFAEMDSYSFASEIAMHQLSIEFAATLDGLLCNPRLAAEFDRLAATYAPGFTPLQYRWAALAIRKRAMQAKKVARTRYGDWLTAKLPASKPLAKNHWAEFAVPGVYLLVNRRRQRLYVGETLNIHSRLEQLSQIPAWQRLEPSSVIPIPASDQPFALQAMLVERMQPLMNSRLLCGDGQGS